MPTTPRPKPVALRIELLDVAPLVWRRVLVSNQWTLASLHGYLQWVMGWTDTHAHEFEIGEGMVAPDWWIEDIGQDRDARGYWDECRVSVAAVASELGIRGEFECRYDMGDGWQHRIVVESLPHRLTPPLGSGLLKLEGSLAMCTWIGERLVALGILMAKRRMSLSGSILSSTSSWRYLASELRAFSRIRIRC